MASKRLFFEKKTVELKNGKTIIVCREVFEISPTDKGLFLGKYKIGWVAFDVADPDKKLIMDAHRPHGLHVHVFGVREELEIKTLIDAENCFRELVIKHFGEPDEEDDL